MTLALRALIVATLLASTASAQSLELVGLDGTTRTLSMAELAALPQVEVAFKGRDSSRVVLKGPTVRSLMTLVGAPAGHELRGPNLLLVVVAEASDGYKVAYALGEVDEQFGASPVIVGISQNGGALPAAEGPLRIAMGGAAEHKARWIRNLTRLKLIRVAP